MNARETIFESLKNNRPAGEHPLPDLPTFPTMSGDKDLTTAFSEMVNKMGGQMYQGDASPQQAIQELFPDAKVIASAVPEVKGNRDLTQVEHPRDLHDVDVSVVRALFGIAETGTVALPDEHLIVNSMAYLAQHLIVLINPKTIVAGLQEAYRRPEMDKYHYLAFHTGPSATADIEGVLIHGAQGVRSLTVILTE